MLTTVRRRIPWPLLLFVAVSVFLDWLFWIALQSFWTRPITPILAFSLAFGQASFATMLGGLWGRTWIAGWLLAVGLIGGTIATIWIASFTYFNAMSLGWQVVGQLLYVPVAILGACAPLLAFRSTCGWSLTRSNDIHVPRVDHRIEDLLLFSVVVACNIAITMLPVTRGPGAPAAWQFLLFGSGYSLLFIVPVTYITFRMNSWGKRLLGYGAMVSVVLAIQLTFMIWTSTFTQLGESVWVLLVWAGTWLCGIVALLSSGYRLTTYQPVALPAVQEGSSPFDLTTDETQAKNQRFERGRLQSRCLTIGLVTFVLALVLGNTYYDRMELARYREMADPVAYFQAAVERLDYRQGEIIGVKMSADATLEDLQRVHRRASKIEHLDLSGTKFNAQWLPVLQAFPQLQQLDLSRTPITDQDMQSLRQVSRLFLADTQVSFPRAMEYAQLGTHTLDLSGTHVSDEQLQALEQFPNYLQVLKLARTSITDSGVSALMEKSGRTKGGWGFRTVDLSDTKVIGTCLDHANCPYTVHMDGTLITDAVLGSLLANPNWLCHSISLRRTQITPAMLPALNSRSVALGQGQITEADLLALTGAVFTSLRLNGPEFTGEALATGKIRVSNLDLSGSSVTDEILQKYYALGWINAITLSNTKVTIAGIDRLNSSQVDLRGTQIRAADVLQKDDLPYGAILMRHEACTPEDILDIRYSYIKLDEEYIYPDW